MQRKTPTAELRAATSQPPMVTDSEWFGLSAEEQLAWAKTTKDPRIAVGSYSPLEKKIKCLGGTHSSGVRKLLVKKFQQESKIVDQLKTVSSDFRFAQADAHYYQQSQEMMTKAWNYKPEVEWDANPEEEVKPKCKEPENGKTWDYLVPERELNHIEKHIHRAERARGLRDHKYRPIPQNLSCEMLSPKPEDEKKKTIPRPHKTVPKKPKMAWAKEQIKQHKDRMMRARVLTEQRQDRRKTPKFTSHGHPHFKSKAKKVEEKEFEKVKAYPIFQPSKEKLLEVTVLMEKSKSESMKKPLQREVLCMPPFLKSQLQKHKKLNLFS